MDIDNINMTETETDKNDDIALSDYNDDNSAMSDRESPLETLADDDIENNEVDKNSTEEVPSPLIYGRKTNDPTKVKSSKRPHSWSLQWVTHMWIKMPQATKYLYI